MGQQASQYHDIKLVSENGSGHDYSIIADWTTFANRDKFGSVVLY